MTICKNISKKAYRIGFKRFCKFCPIYRKRAKILCIERVEHDSFKEIKTLIVFNYLEIGRWVGLFFRHIKRYKKLSLQHKYKYIKTLW